MKRYSPLLLPLTKKSALILFSLLASSVSYASSKVDLALIEATPHEIALTQVLSEICPTLLDSSQKERFFDSYEMHLKLLMPNLDTKAAMQQIGTQKEYRIILEGIRKWTLSYPSQENKELCIEFAEASF